MIDWNDPREPAMLRRLLEAEERERGDGVAQAILDRMVAEGERHDRTVAEARERAMEHKPILRDALREAQRLGTYVAAGTRATLTPGEHDPYVHTRADAYWNGVLRLLHEQGIHTQMVVRTREGGGVAVLGYRLAHDTDSRSSVEESTVWREGGRCARCGVTQDRAAVTRCRWAWPMMAQGHDFDQANEEAGDGGAGAVGRPDAGASDQAS